MKVLLVSEHQLLQSLLHIALERRADVEIIGEYLDGQGALAALTDKTPDVVILGMMLPDMSGLEVMVRMRKKIPSIRVLAVTSQKEETYLVPFLLAGGRGYLSYYPSDEEFYHALDVVMTDRYYLSQSGAAVLDGVCHDLQQMKEQAKPRSQKQEEAVRPQAILLAKQDLSDREKQVLHLYVNGYSSAEIGRILYMSVNTVETHKKRFKEKLQLSRKAELTRYAKEQGLFEDWD